MKKSVLILALLSALLLGACGGIYDAEYVYSAPYDDETQNTGGTEGEDVRSYAQLEGAITAMVIGARSGGKLRFSSYSGSVADDIAAVCYEIKTQTPMGAYAVEELTYELSRIVSYYTAEVFITYKRSAAEIRDVVTVNGISALQSHLSAKVAEHDRHEVLKVYSSAVSDEYIRGLIHQACLDAPLICDGEPKVKVAAYPSEGVNRIYDIELSYAVDGGVFARRREEAEQLLSEICAPLAEESAGRKALDCAVWLAEHCGGGEEDTAYAALLGGSAGSLGFALAYKAMCDTLDLECLIVEGSLGTLGTQTHFWNIVGIDGDYYHIDVSRIGDAAWEDAFLLSDDMAWGTYMWDAEKYPACNGALRYDDIHSEPSEAQPEDNTQSGRPATPAPSGQPGQTPEPTPSGGDEPLPPSPGETDAPQDPSGQEE